MKPAEEKEFLAFLIRFINAGGKNVVTTPLWKRVVFNVLFLASGFPIMLFLFIEPTVFKFVVFFIVFAWGIACALGLRRRDSDDKWPFFVTYLDRGKIETRIQELSD